MRYLVELFWSEEDGGYIAVVPDLPGCSAFGATPEAAVHEIGDGIEAWIAACRVRRSRSGTDRQGAPCGVIGSHEVRPRSEGNGLGQLRASDKRMPPPAGSRALPCADPTID
jgi:antitoxin HicB